MEAQFEQMLETMKKAGGALNEAGIPWALGGGLACWARGGPETEHDVDFLVKPEDAERAQQALAGAGLRTERPPEGWLLKAFDGDVMVDLIFDPRGGPVDDALLERAEELEVHAIRMKVARLEDVLTQKVLALNEQEPDFSSVLELAHARCASKSTGTNCEGGRAGRRSRAPTSGCWTSSRSSRADARAAAATHPSSSVLPRRSGFPRA